jgi:hypothetical protein
MATGSKVDIIASNATKILMSKMLVPKLRAAMDPASPEQGVFRTAKVLRLRVDLGECRRDFAPTHDHKRSRTQQDATGDQQRQCGSEEASEQTTLRGPVRRATLRTRPFDHVIQLSGQDAASATRESRRTGRRKTETPTSLETEHPPTRTGFLFNSLFALNE